MLKMKLILMGNFRIMNFLLDFLAFVGVYYFVRLRIYHKLNGEVGFEQSFVPLFAF